MYNAQKALGLGILPLFDTNVPYEELALPNTKAAQEIGSFAAFSPFAILPVKSSVNLQCHRRLRSLTVKSGVNFRRCRRLRSLPVKTTANLWKFNVFVCPPQN